MSSKSRSPTSRSRSRSRSNNTSSRTSPSRSHSGYTPVRHSSDSEESRRDPPSSNNTSSDIHIGSNYSSDAWPSPYKPRSKSRSASVKSGRRSSSHRSCSSSRNRRYCNANCPRKSVEPFEEKKVVIENFERVRIFETREEIQEFLHTYSQDKRFDAFTMTIDKIPFVAVSLMNADRPLLDKYYTLPPPTPMKPSTNHLSSPRGRGRKRKNTSDAGASTSTSAKNVKFDDERDDSDGESSSQISRVMESTSKGYSNLWKDRASSNEK